MIEEYDFVACTKPFHVRHVIKAHIEKIRVYAVIIGFE